jgi:HD-like signal output (HDOD) protein
MTMDTAPSPLDALPGAAPHFALRELDTAGLRALVSEIGVPPRPSLLADLQTELRRDEPSMRRMSDLIGTDVALSAALLRTANSPLLGLTRRADTVEAAFALLGYQQCEAIFTEIVMRRMFPADGPVMTRFWDVSSKRARAMTHLARTRRLVSPPLAHTYGLFMDVGIPIMMQRFPGPHGYVKALAKANEAEGSFTEVEKAAHRVDHTLVGALAARVWCVSQTAVLAVRLHHDYAAWAEPMPADAAQLLALGLASEWIIQRYEGLNRHHEWDKGGAAALSLLGIDEAELQEWCDEVHEQFDAAGM